MAKSLGGSEDGMMAPDQPLSIYKQTVAEKDLECAQGLDRVGGGGSKHLAWGHVHGQVHTEEGSVV